MVCSDALRTRFRAIGTIGTGLAVMLGPGVARAQTFPQDNQWVPLTCDGQVATDPVGNVQPPALDVVGDAADPAAYVFMDTAWLYLRLRMSATVLQGATTYAPYAWACLVRTAGTPGSYLVWDGVDGLANPNDVALLQNANPHPGNATQQPANTTVATYAVATSARQAAATSQLGGNPNFFVDWAVALSDLAKVGITPSTPVTFICGTSKTEHVLDEDVVAQQQACGGVLDTVECVGGGCATCTTATACGPGCVACGGATPVCDPTFGCTVACASDAQCGGATPVCDTVVGGCVANGGGTGNATGPDVIEGGSCACEVVGSEAPTGNLAALALGAVAALSARTRRRPSRSRPIRS
jgi:MYXO-CTERM domain-containing protein